MVSLGSVREHLDFKYLGSGKAAGRALLSPPDVMQATEFPFLNAIFDKEPLQNWIDGRVVLLGEAARKHVSSCSSGWSMLAGGLLQCLWLGLEALPFASLWAVERRQEMAI